MKDGWKSLRHNKLECRRADEKADELTKLLMANSLEAVSGPKLPAPELRVQKDGEPFPDRPDPIRPEAMENITKLLDEALRNGYKEFDKANYEQAGVEWSKALMCINHIKELNRGKISEEEGDDHADLQSSDSDTENKDPKVLSLARRVERDISEYWLKLNANMALVSLKLRMYREVVEHANHVLDVDDTDAKALFRKASGFMGLRSFDKAIKTLEKLLLHEPDSAAAKALLQEARAKEEAAKLRLKRTRKKMMDFSLSDDHDERLEKTRCQKFMAFMLNIREEGPAWIHEWGYAYAKLFLQCTWSIWVGIVAYYFAYKNR